LQGAKGVLINITGGYDLTLFELDEAANRIREEVDPEANIIVGSTLDTSMEGMMRVSVVATGIDAVDVNSEIPVPRRSMAEPLQQMAALEEAAHQSEVGADPVAAELEEPSFFDNVQTTAHEQAEDVFGDNDDLPAPAYQPEPTQHAGYSDSIEALEEDVAQFVAPRPASAGTPSSEAIERLQAAVHNRPQSNPQPAVQEPVVAAEKPRFGINSLINRMTGHADEQPAEQRQQPQVQAQAEAPETEIEQDRVEIPAFLRRQAN